MPDTTAEVIAEIVAAAPPLTDEQRSHLATLLRPQPSALAMQETATRPVCPYCNTARFVRLDGRFRGHGSHGQPCPGSYQLAQTPATAEENHRHV